MRQHRCLKTLSPKKLKINECIVALHGCRPDEDREQHQGNEKCRQADPFANMVHTVEKEHEPRGEEEEADKVEISRPGFGTVFGKKADRQNDSQKTDRNIYQEQPTPGRMLKNRPSEHRPEEWSQQNRDCGVTEDARRVPPGGAHYHHLRQRSHQTSAHSLEDSKANQRVRGPRESAECRREREDRKTPQIERFCSELPDEPA